MLWKSCTQYVNKFGKLSSDHRAGKGKFSFQPQKKGNAKECFNYHTIVIVSHANKVMLKILQASFSNTWTEIFQMYKLCLEKAEKSYIKLPKFIGS